MLFQVYFNILKEKKPIPDIALRYCKKKLEKVSYPAAVPIKIILFHLNQEYFDKLPEL